MLFNNSQPENISFICENGLKWFNTFGAIYKFGYLDGSQIAELFEGFQDAEKIPHVHMQIQQERGVIDSNYREIQDTSDLKRIVDNYGKVVFRGEGIGWRQGGQAIEGDRILGVVEDFAKFKRDYFSKETYLHIKEAKGRVPMNFTFLYLFGQKHGKVVSD